MKFLEQNNFKWLMIFLLVFFLSMGGPSAQETQEDTYSISLVQTAEVDKEIIEVEDKKVLAESYTIQRGDHLWQLNVLG